MGKNKETPLNQRVVATGLGIVSPLGTGKKEYYQELMEGKSGVGEVVAFDVSNARARLGAEVRNFSPRDFISLKNLRRMDKISAMTTAATRMALDDAGLAVKPENRDRIGIILGTAFGATDVTLQVAGALLVQGPSSVNPILVPNTVMNAAAAHASIELGFRGVNTTVTQYAVSAETAISYAASEIKRGAADVLLTGGADILSKFYYEALSRFRGLSPDDGKTPGTRPFDLERNGYVAGEGCGILCLESLAAAKERGARIYCEITGTGLGASPTTPTGWPADTAGIKLAFHRALGQANIAAGDVSAIMAAANGGRLLDQAEAAAYEEIFALSEDKPYITSIKGALGESFSGGGLRACALALSLEHQCLPPTAGLKNPLLPLNFVMRGKKEIMIKNMVLAGITFGGTYAYLVFCQDKNGR